MQDTCKFLCTEQLDNIKDIESVTSAALLKGKGKGHPCTGTEALYRPYGP